MHANPRQRPSCRAAREVGVTCRGPRGARPLRALLVAVALGLGGASAAVASVRPDQPGSGAYGIPGYQVAQQPPVCRVHTCVHWVASTQDAPRDLRDLDGDGEPDGLERIAENLDRAWQVYTAPDALGWQAPLPDDGLGGDDRVDAYVQDLRGHASGVAPRDEGQGTALRVHGFLLLDQAFVRADLGPQASRRVAAHELAHLLQYAYDGYFESWLAEATAVWMAAEVDGSPTALDGQAASWAQLTEQPLLGSLNSDGSPEAKAYASAVWLRWLAARHGRGVVRAIWEQGAKRSPYAYHPLSVQAALASATAFSDEFVAFAAANAEWNAPDSPFAPANSFPDAERVARLAPDQDTTLNLDHTTFALVDLPVRDAESVQVHVTAPDGTPSAAAIVGRVGAGTRTAIRRLPGGGVGDVTLEDPGRFDRLTAVIVDTDTALAEGGRKDANGQYGYAHDAQPYVVRAVYGAPSGAAAPTPDAPPPGGPAPAAMPSPPVLVGSPVPSGLRADRTAPRVRVLRVRRVAGRGFRVTLRASEACRVRLSVRVGGHTGSLSRALPARRARAVVVTVPTRGRRVRVVVRAADAAGNRSALRRSFRW